MAFQNYETMSDQELVDTYNAVMAGAWPGDEAALEYEIVMRRLDTEGRWQWPAEGPEN